VGQQRYRFANFLEAFIVVDSTNTVVGHGFTPESGLKMNPSSFLGTQPQPFNAIQSVQIGKEPIRFVQIVGSRTNAAENIGEAIARGIGRQVAAVVAGLPPIWTELELSVFKTGQTTARILRHSLFPSVEWYVQDSLFGHLGHVQDPNLYFNRYDFDARNNLARWFDEGWGPVTAAQTARTPCSGNPFNIPKPHGVNPILR